MSDGASAIHTQMLTKDYGAGRGIFDLDLDVAEGEVFGFLGPNGAGKTTTIKLLMGLSHATRGAASIFGLDADRDAVAVKKRVGYVPGELPQFGGWRGSEIVAYIAGLRGDVDDAAVEAISKRMDLDLGRKYREYSHGNKQKLALLLAFAPRAGLLILDEPTSGLDPLHQQEFYGLVRDARSRGATVFMSSHVLSEVDRVCDRIALVRKGELVLLSGIDELRTLAARPVRVSFDADMPVARDLPPGTAVVELSPRSWSLNVEGPLGPLLRAIATLPVRDIEIAEARLEDVILKYYRDGARGGAK
jgi:ABC-2 type transport system ATP-binding protein